jgi:hypothetical protein
MTRVPFVHSGYERKENDDYQTVDPRCVEALLHFEGWRFRHKTIVDVCASHGSAIQRQLVERGFTAYGLSEALVDLSDFNVVITNPPYARGIVDKIVNHVVSEIEKEHIQFGFFLMRANWDFAVSRAALFDSPLYLGQTRMRFRPWWSEERKAQPIHNYVWHSWGRDILTQHDSSDKYVRYYPESK